MPPLKPTSMKKILFIIAITFIAYSCEKSADSLSNPTSGNPTGAGGSMARFAIVGNYLYTVDKSDLKVFDLSNPAVPVFKRTVPVGFEIETIYPFKDKLFIGSTGMVHIFSIQDPSYPTKLSEAISPDVIRRCDPVVAKDTVAYATLRTNGECGGLQSILAVFDIRDITKPVQKNAIPVSEPHGLGYSGNTLYVCDKLAGLMVFDISQPYSPQLVKTIKDGDYIDVIPYGNVLICWVTTGMILYDISTPANPVHLTTIN